MTENTASSAPRGTAAEDEVAALASDLIHREIVRLREKKPVVACFGDVAASGGYYVAAPCQRIVAQPTSITGSIGVVSMRLLLSGVAERVGLRPQTLRAAPHADMLSPYRELDAREQEMMTAETEAIYRAFVDVVARGRQRSAEEIERVARGRVWSGADAIHAGLVDELGGLDRAVAALRALVPELSALDDTQIALRVLVPGRESEPEPPPEPPPAAPAGAVFWPGSLSRAAAELAEASWMLGLEELGLLYALIPELG